MSKVYVWEFPWTWIENDVDLEQAGVSLGEMLSHKSRKFETLRTVSSLLPMTLTFVWH